MKCFKSDCIVFYTLFLDEKEMQSQANSENLRDFLEEKICVVLNLPREKEYFLRYALSESGNAYHCVLLDKEILASYVSDATEYLSHPCFLCGIQNGYVLIKDWNLNWVFIGFKEQNIVDFYALDSLGEMCEKLELLSLDGIWLWEVGEITTDEKESLKKLKFNLHFMVQDFENMELPETWNFNPIEKSLPFLKMRVGMALGSLAAGVTLGLVLWGILAFVGLLEQRKNANLKMQINALQNELEILGKSRTQAQNTLISLQEKLQNLQVVYHANVESLKSFREADFQVAQSISALNPYLEKFNVKIAYFGVEKDGVMLLLIGKNALKILEIIEEESLGKVHTMGEYGEFVWSVIKQ